MAYWPIASKNSFATQVDIRPHPSVNSSSPVFQSFFIKLLKIQNNEKLPLRGPISHREWKYVELLAIGVDPLELHTWQRLFDRIYQNSCKCMLAFFGFYMKLRIKKILSEILMNTKFSIFRVLKAFPWWVYVFRISF